VGEGNGTLDGQSSEPAGNRAALATVPIADRLRDIDAAATRSDRDERRRGSDSRIIERLRDNLGPDTARVPQRDSQTRRRPRRTFAGGGAQPTGFTARDDPHVRPGSARRRRRGQRVESHRDVGVATQ
jgi:hypothetical protein